MFHRVVQRVRPNVLLAKSLHALRTERRSQREQKLDSVNLRDERDSDCGIVSRACGNQGWDNACKLWRG